MVWGYPLLAFVVLSGISIYKVNTKQYKHALYCIFIMTAIALAIIVSFLYLKVLGGMI